MQLKANPFTPQLPIIDPEKFAGRKNPIKNAVDALYNNKNIIISGERGIGKSSLAYQLINLAEGEKTLINKLHIETSDFEFSYLIADHRCVPGNTIADILNSLHVSLYSQINKKGEDTKKTEWGLDLKLFHYNQKHESEKIKISDMVSKFVDLINEIVKSDPGHYNGICFLIDEVDALPPDIELAHFLKASVEALQFKGHKNVSFIIAGITGTIINLITQHPSFARLFENIELHRMTGEELEEIIISALRGTGVGIIDNTKKQIILYADRFPEPVHLLGYHSFKFDNNSIIEQSDLQLALNFIIKELKNQEFNDLYEKAGRGLSEAIIRFMAMSDSVEMSVNHISKMTGIKERTTALIMADLASSGILIKVKGKKYKIKDPLFRIYLRWTFNNT